ncbi:MAG: hypothetical protein ACPG31_05365 [Planctomycetota bacterium]
MTVWWLDPFSPRGAEENPTPQYEIQPSEPAEVGDPDPAKDSSELTPTESVDQADGPSEQPPSVQRLTDGFLILQDPEENPVQGLSILVEEDDALLGWMAIPGRVGSAIYYESILQEGESKPNTDGLPITEEGNRADLHFAIAEGYEPIVEPWEPIAAGNTHRTTLKPVAPITVTIQDSNGDPIPGAEVWVRWIGELTLNEEGSTVERLQGRHYQEAVITDEKGKATVTVCFQGRANSLFVRPGDAFASQQAVCSDGEDVVITCESAFTIKGKITIDGKLPDREVRLMAMLPVGESFSFLESARSKDEGRYSIGGVLAGYPTLLVQAMGEDLAMQMRHIPGGKPGEIIEIDFDMKPGLGGELQILDSWGNPMPGATVQLVGEGDQRHVYRYEANEEGQLTLPVAFPQGGRYWMELGFSGMSMRLPEPFEGGEKMTLQPVKQARIASVKLPAGLLGEAAIAELKWKSLEPMAGGQAVWSASEEGSPILVAGRGVLSVTLSDGRNYFKNLFLESGSMDSHILEIQASTIRFQMPDGQVGSAYLMDQFGNYLFGGEGLQGSVEIPCWEGTFSLDIYWEDGSLLRPGVRVPASGLDLGQLGLANTGTIWGTVRDEDGNPVGWCDLTYTSQDGYYYQTGESDIDGSFFLQGIPQGSYYLYANSHQYHGGAGESRIQQFAITAAQPEVNLDVIMGVAEGDLVVEHGTGQIGGMEILHVTESGIQFREASPTGASVLPAQRSSGWVGAVHAQGTSVKVASAPAQAGPGTVRLPDFHTALRQVKIVDETGAPHLDMILRIELDGFPPTGRLAPDGNGTLQLSMVGDGLWTLHARDGLGASHVISLHEAMAAGQFVVPREKPTRALMVVDAEGHALSHAEAMDEAMRQVFRANAKGQIDIPLRNDWVVVDARGFLPVWVDSRVVGTVELPKAVSGVTVAIPEKKGRISWSHAFVDRTVFPTEMQLSGDETSIVLPPVAKGELTLTLWSDSGESLTTKTVAVTQDGSAIVLD